MAVGTGHNGNGTQNNQIKSDGKDRAGGKKAGPQIGSDTVQAGFEQTGPLERETRASRAGTGDGQSKRNA